MNHIGALCEHDASSTCPRCEAELRASAHAEQEADRAQEAWERALHNWEKTSTELKDVETQLATLLWEVETRHTALLRKARALDAQEQQRAQEARELDARERQRAADEAAMQEASHVRAEEERWQRALSTARTEVDRQARSNLILRLIAVIATAHLLSADWVATWLVALAFAGGAALAAGRLLLALPRHRLQRQAIAAHGGWFTPNRSVRGPGTAVLWILVQLPAVGAVASALALLDITSGTSHLPNKDIGPFMLSGLVHLAVIWATGFRRVAVEKPFGLLPEDGSAVKAAHDKDKEPRLPPDTTVNSTSQSAPFQLPPVVNRTWIAEQDAARSQREAEHVYAEQIAQLESELAALASAAHLRPLPHAGLEALRAQELQKHRENANDRAAQLAKARTEVAVVREKRGRPLLDGIVCAMAGNAVPGSLGRWSNSPWYDALPHAEEGGFTTRLKLFLEGRTPSINQTNPLDLPDGPHPSAEITDAQGEQIILIAVCGDHVRLGLRCAACGKHTISKDTITNVTSLLAATPSLEHHCKPGAQAQQAHSPYSEI